MDFGKKVKVGNFEVLKFTRSLGKGELRSLREQMGIPKDVQKHLSRSGMPFIKVSAVSGMWAVEFATGTTMFRWIDENAALLPHSEPEMKSVFTMMYADTTVFGDSEYWKRKGDALRDYMERVNAPDDDEDAEEEALEEVKAVEDIEEMAAEAEKGDEE